MNKNKNKSGRPTLPDTKKKRNKVVIYLSDDELENFNKAFLTALKHSPTLSRSDFFRFMINNFDETVFSYLSEPHNSEVKNYMRSKLVYGNIFANDSNLHL